MNWFKFIFCPKKEDIRLITSLRLFRKFMFILRFEMVKNLLTFNLKTGYVKACFVVEVGFS